jgi:hypothetical protein
MTSNTRGVARRIAKSPHARAACGAPGDGGELVHCGEISDGILNDNYKTY